jgi:hypothetical protein
MPSALTGAVRSTAQYDATDTTGAGQCVADSTDTNCYVAEAVAGTPRIHKIVIGTGAVAGAPWPLTTVSFPAGVALSADDATLYVLLDSGAMYSTPVSSPSLTLLPATFNGLDGFTTAWSGLLLDPAFPRRLLAWNRNARKIYVYDLDSQQATFYAVPGGTHFVVGVGRYLPDPHVFLVTLSTSGSGYGGSLILKWYRRQHRWESVAGNGATGNGASGGTAVLTAINGGTCRTFAADREGRVYLTRDPTTFCKVVDGVLTDLNTALPANVNAGVWYLPTLNQALVRTTGGRVSVVS